MEEAAEKGVGVPAEALNHPDDGRSWKGLTQGLTGLDPWVESTIVATVAGGGGWSEEPRGEIEGPGGWMPWLPAQQSHHQAALPDLGFPTCKRSS